MQLPFATHQCTNSGGFAQVEAEYLGGSKAREELGGEGDSAKQNGPTPGDSIVKQPKIGSQS